MGTILDDLRERQHLHGSDGHGAPAAPYLQHMVAPADACCCDKRIQLGKLRLLQGTPCQACKMGCSGVHGRPT